MKNRVFILFCCMIFRNYMFESEGGIKERIYSYEDLEFLKLITKQKYLSDGFWREGYLSSKYHGGEGIIREDEWEGIKEKREEAQIKLVSEKILKVEEEKDSIKEKFGPCVGMFRINMNEVKNRDVGIEPKNERCEKKFDLDTVLTILLGEYFFSSKDCVNDIMWEFIYIQLLGGKGFKDLLPVAPLTTINEEFKSQKRRCWKVTKVEWEDIKKRRDKRELDKMEDLLKEQDKTITEKLCYFMIEGFNTSNERNKTLEEFEELNLEEELLAMRKAILKDETFKRDMKWYIICKELGLRFFRYCIEGECDVKDVVCIDKSEILYYVLRRYANSDGDLEKFIMHVDSSFFKHNIFKKLFMEA